MNENLHTLSLSFLARIEQHGEKMKPYRIPSYKNHKKKSSRTFFWILEQKHFRVNLLRHQKNVTVLKTSERSRTFHKLLSPFFFLGN